MMPATKVGPDVQAISRIRPDLLTDSGAEIDRQRPKPTVLLSRARPEMRAKLIL